MKTVCLSSPQTKFVCLNSDVFRHNLSRRWHIISFLLRRCPDSQELETYCNPQESLHNWYWTLPTANSFQNGGLESFSAVPIVWRIKTAKIKNKRRNKRANKSPFIFSDVPSRCSLFGKDSTWNALEKYCYFCPCKFNWWHQHPLLIG